MYFLKSRYYDPETGRFISPDAIEYADPETINGLNLYAYCGNNPVMNIDPEGHKWWHWLIGLFVIVALAIATVVTAGGAAAAAGAIYSALSVGSAATLGTTISAYALIGASITFISYGIATEIESIAYLGTGSSLRESINVFNSYGESAMYATFFSGAIYAIGGYYSHVDFGTHTLGKSRPLSKFYNINTNTKTYYDAQKNMQWSKHFTSHGIEGHGSPHWHLENPHSAPYNSFFDFLIDFIKQYWWLK